MAAIFQKTFSRTFFLKNNRFKSQWSLFIWMHLTQWPLRDAAVMFEWLILKLISRTYMYWAFQMACEITLTQVNATIPGWLLVDIGSDNGLMSSGNKPLPEPMLIQIRVAIWHREATIGRDKTALVRVVAWHRIIPTFESTNCVIIARSTSGLLPSSPVVRRRIETTHGIGDALKITPRETYASC